MSNPAQDFPDHEAPWLDVNDSVAEYIATTVAQTVARLLSPQARKPESWVSTDEAAAILGVDRVTLDKMAGKAPPDLPGAPLDVSHCTHRRWRWWDPSRLPSWASAYQVWKVEQERKAKPHSSRRTVSRAKASPDGGVVDWNAVGRQK
ncbi:MAG: hypothetical protein ABMA64_29900 [Myxococcota bacterium]